MLRLSFARLLCSSERSATAWTPKRFLSHQSSHRRIAIERFAEVAAQPNNSYLIRFLTKRTYAIGEDFMQLQLKMFNNNTQADINDEIENSEVLPWYTFRANVFNFSFPHRIHLISFHIFFFFSLSIRRRFARIILRLHIFAIHYV